MALSSYFVWWVCSFVYNSIVFCIQTYFIRREKCQIVQIVIMFIFSDFIFDLMFTFKGLSIHSIFALKFYYQVIQTILKILISANQILKNSLEISNSSKKIRYSSTR